VSVAYVVTSYRYPEQVLRLARTLRAGSPDAPLLIHHDDRRSQLDVAALAGLGGVQLVRPPTAVAWGWASQLEMLLRCFAWALERVAFDWLVVLSGQDYPIRPLAEIERDLLDSPYDGYVEGIEVCPPRWTRGELDEFSRRYFYRHRPIRNPGAVLRRAIMAARPALLVREMPWGVVLGRRCATPFSPALPCRRGADWLSLSRRSVEVVVRAAQTRPELMRHYRRTVLPTESFPHTVLHAEPTLRLSSDTRRFTLWPSRSAHPAPLTVADLDRILGSSADFARKFDPTIDPVVIDELDRAVTGRS
jgi:Core-2/I-Branching enzyme